MTIKDIRAYFYIFFGGDVGLGKAYALGYVDFEDIDNFLITQLKKGTIKKGFLKKILGRIFQLIRKNTKLQAKKNIMSHYDVGNDFYKEWLDHTMTYSSGLFLSQNDTIEEAQTNKYLKIINQLKLTDQNVLEIGCGWGGFIEALMLNTSCKLTAITISDEQYRFCLQKIKDKKWEDRVDLKCIDYRDLKNNIQYDAIVSIEMVEALGYEYWDEYFKKIKTLLKPEGECLIQAITLDLKKFEKYVKGTDFIRTYIFPGGCLIQLSYLLNNNFLDLLNYDEFTSSYVKTLKIWINKIEEKKSLLGQKYPNEFIRLWLFYLHFSVATFQCNKTQVGQFHFKNNKKQSLSI